MSLDFRALGADEFEQILELPYQLSQKDQDLVAAAYHQIPAFRAAIHDEIFQSALNRAVAAAEHPVVIDFLNPNPGVLAYVYLKGDRVHLCPSLLFGHSNRDIDHVIAHEESHLANGVAEIAVQREDFSDDQKRALAEALGLYDLPFDKVNLMEGFNEFGTQEKTGNKIAGVYEDDVLVAQKLEELAESKFGKSLLELFHQGESDAIVDLVKLLAQCLVLSKSLNEMDLELAQQTELYQKIWKEGVFDRFEVKTFAQADEILANELELMSAENSKYWV
jgi:hypothetical protein